MHQVTPMEAHTCRRHRTAQTKTHQKAFVSASFKSIKQNGPLTAPMFILMHSFFNQQASQHTTATLPLNV